ncbi:hypothetical protein GH714_027077 [Hevea brasiliensis]|uniref:Uncharacterized protein n=1 Tax=Hevea brasiliensis TaxID=3981 RepID=A0A6A6L2L3_HEVBR|nr:hypothetical protein GH714_027077 [Hevea brasiliensis]
MTGLGTSIDLLIETAKRLSNFAKLPGISFEFHPIAKKFGEIDVSMLPLRRGEILAVHRLQHSLYDATGPDWKTMRLLEELAPRVITLAEQDISHGGSFLDRSVGKSTIYWQLEGMQEVGKTNSGIGELSLQQEAPLCKYPLVETPWLKHN